MNYSELPQYKQVMTAARRLAISLSLLPALPAANADDERVRDLMAGFGVRNYNPFIQIFGIPALDRDTIVAGGTSKLSMTVDVTSHFSGDNSGDEILWADGETYRLELRYRRGLGRGWEIGGVLPLVSHAGGFLDGFINDWHDFFDLPTGGRTDVEDDRLRFFYARGGVTQVTVEDGTSGLGDVLVFAGRAIPVPADDTRLAGRVQVKLPTGDSARLLGSGAWDAAVSLQMTGRWTPKLYWYAGAALSYLGSGDVLPQLQRNWLVSASAGVAWRAYSRIALKLQFDGQSSAYHNTDLNELDSDAFQTTIGGSMRLTRHIDFDLGVVENWPNGDVSPDVSFHLRWRGSW